MRLIRIRHDDGNGEQEWGPWIQHETYPGGPNVEEAIVHSVRWRRHDADMHDVERAASKAADATGEPQAIGMLDGSWTVVWPSVARRGAFEAFKPGGAGLGAYGQ